MARIVHFEIPADNPEAMMEFYGKVFGWEFDKWGEEGYWLAKTGDTSEHGIDGAVMKRREPGQPIVNTIDVEDIDGAIEKIKENGGEIVVEKMPVPHIGWLVYFKDTEGNIFGVMQSDSEAG